jgi:hypothetical protein
MNFFKSGLQSVLGTNDHVESDSGAETVSENGKNGFVLKFDNK